jgi:hypothetical protein
LNENVNFRKGHSILGALWPGACDRRILSVCAIPSLVLLFPIICAIFGRSARPTHFATIIFHKFRFLNDATQKVTSAMASFLRQLSILNRQQSDTLGATIGTLNPDGGDLSMAESIEELNAKQAEIRERYSQLLMQGASTSAQFQNAVMFTVNAQVK